MTACRLDLGTSNTRLALGTLPALENRFPDRLRLDNTEFKAVWGAAIHRDILDGDMTPANPIRIFQE